MGILNTISHAFKEGGWGMWPILISLIVMIAIIVERSVYLSKSKVDKDKLLKLLKSQVMSGNIEGAIQVCSGNPAPLTRIVQAGLMKYNRTDHEVQSAMDEAALRELPRLGKWTPFLAMLANFAVMAGLVGTISGMIGAFSGAAEKTGEAKTRALTAGIAEALNCTAFGIGSSLIGLVGFSVLTHITTARTNDINEVSVQVVNLLMNNRSQLAG